MQTFSGLFEPRQLADRAITQPSATPSLKGYRDGDISAIGLYRTLYREFRQKLKQARLEGLTQAEVARRPGKPQSYVAKCESGARRVDMFEELELARIYKKPIGFFTTQALKPKQL